MTHIMLDLETWGKHPGCDIRSIGAVVFDPESGLVCGPEFVPEDTFYIATDNPIVDVEWYDPVYKYPLTRDPETVDWWNDQSPEAQAAFADPVDLKLACVRFSDWIAEVSTENARIWANDPHFDVSILEAVYRTVGLPVPWHYRSPRSMKTVTDITGMTRDDYSVAEVEHHALYDAIAQAKTVCEAYKRLGLRHA